MSWFSSWIPRFPNINLSIPSGLQGRFITFVLKKTLGHFLEPGQLDYRQIDSQIGSGYVQVNDLQLNSETINGYLRGLPITLQDGTISSVKVRIPWPNPLASTLGFSIKSVHLKFILVPVDNSERREEPDLADSVASVAESFVQELSSGEEESLWQSFHQETEAQAHVQGHYFPGGLDSFSAIKPDAEQLDLEPTGVSVFANLVERLLARFEFDAQDITITLIHPDNISITLSLQDIQYLTDTKSNSPNPSVKSPTQGENRTLTINGITLALRDLSSWKDHTSLSSGHNLPTGSASTQTSRPPSRASSTSSMDDETRYAMSQSLAVLPPRASSPCSSVSSSMYESAISAPSSILPIPDITEEIFGEPTRRLTSESLSEGREEMFLSFGTQPLVFQIRTSAFLLPDDNPFASSSDATSTGADLIADLSIGIIACALKPQQITSLTRLVRTITPTYNEAEVAAKDTSKPMSKIIPPIYAAAEIRACVILLISSPPRFDERNEILALTDFFERPLVPPRLEHGYSRIYLDSLSSSLSPVREESLHGKLSIEPPVEVQFGIADFSLFFFSKVPHGRNSALAVFPLLITDPCLSSHYSMPPRNDQMKATLPNFDIIDWTQGSCQGFGTRLSQWRCKTSKGRDNPSHVALRLKLKPSITVFPDRQVEIVDDLFIQFAPLHIRIDLEYILHPAGPLSFYEELFLSEMPLGDQPQTTVDQSIPNPLPKKTKKKDTSKHMLRSNVKFPFIRLSIRCPPPVSLEYRSGILIIDLRDVDLVPDPPLPRPTTRFTQWEESPLESDGSRETVLFGISFERAIVAFSLVNAEVATSFLCIGPIIEGNNELSRSQGSDGYTPALNPRIRIIKPKPDISGAASTLALSIDLPSIHVHLDKIGFDALQYWTDDVTQLLERMSASEVELQTNDSRNPSIIGSRFLAKSKNSSTTGGNRDEVAETVVKVSITKTSVCILVPCTDEGPKLRSFYTEVSDLDVLVELNAERKQQTILTVGIADLVVENTSIQGGLQRLFSLTSPTSLSTSPISIVKLRFSSNTLATTGTKETRIKLTLCGFTYTFYPDMRWFSDLAAFAKNPPGTFESVIPSDRTRISVKVSNGSIRLLAPLYPGAIVSHMQDLELSTDVVGDSQDSAFYVLATCVTLLAIDDVQQHGNHLEGIRTHPGVPFWTTTGYAILAEFMELDTNVTNQLSTKPTWKVLIDRVVLRLHLCADSLTAVTAFSHDFGALFKDKDEEPKPSNKRPTVVEKSTIMSSVEDLAFKRMPEIGPAPDMISDDLPTNLDYLDESFGAAAGLRELVDEDLDQFSDGEVDIQSTVDDPHIVSRIGGETIKVFDPKGLDLLEDYFLSIPPEKSERMSHSSDAAVSVRISSGSFKLLLYDGYDWTKTRKTIEEEVKEMRKRLAKIRQLVANGQVQEPIIEDTSALLFNSLHIGLEQDDDTLEEPSALIAAIDDELQEDPETASQSSWQSLRPSSSTKSRIRSTRIHGKRLTRSKTPSMEFSLEGVYAEFDQFDPSEPLVSRTFVAVKDLEILDHIKTSTWKKFLTDLRSDSRGNIRETESNMVRIELQGIRPVAGNSAEEVRLRAKILPLRLYVDQDAVDFLKKFFSFKDPSASPDTDTSANEGETYIQLGEIFPIDLKLDYKPRRVDYRALKEGRTIELMNFFHFDGAEMTLRHITLAGVTGWPRFFEMLNDLWTPDVKATQLVEVISGVAPIRSVVNVGSGVADLILLPIAQYKKDGRIVRGVQKGATAFVKSTAIEAIKMGAKLATGTQVILEQAEGILGGQFEVPITAEPVQVQYPDEPGFDDEEDEMTAETISKYAQQPADLREGVQSAYKSLQKNLNSAAQTILAVPMEVYERSGNEGPVRSVIRAVPIAVLKPMIGASEAVSKTLLGLHNTLDPNVRHDNNAKYK